MNGSKRRLPASGFAARISGVVAASVLASGCWAGGNDLTFPAVEDPTDTTVAGVIVVDGVPGAGLFVELGDVDLGVLTISATTDDTGGFVFDVPPELNAREPFVQVTFETTTSGEERIGSVQVRRPVVGGELEHELRFAAPTTCADDCDVLLPDLVPIVDGALVSPTDPLPPQSIFFDTITEPGRTLMRFASLTANVGDGPLHVLGLGFDDDGALNTTQRLWTQDMRYQDRLAGAFVFHEGHDHIHLEDFEEYRLLDTSGGVVTSSGKVSFCLLDSVALDDPEELVIDFGIHLGVDCGTNEQAINPGFADYYGATLPDQWIDVTDVAPGDYSIEIIADPSDFLVEADETNNAVSFPVTIPQR